MVDLDFNDISRRLHKFRFPEVDLVIGIATGGTVPATLLAHQLNKPFHSIKINYRNPDNSPAHESPVLLSEPLPEFDEHTRILLVDDVSVTGKTLEFAKGLLTNYKVITFALKGKADLVLFTDIKTCVNWPWKIR
jgi:hypoxanthine phosphoribosyltransferase